MFYFDPSNDTELVVDASLVALGAMLLQHPKDTPRDAAKVVAHASRDFETRYSHTGREALAVVWGC